MKLSWKDIVTTLVAIVVGTALVAKLRSYDWALLGSWKGAVGTLGILGLFVATADEEDLTHFNAWGAFEWMLALAGVGLAIAGLIVASKALFVILAADILALWLTSLVRHTFSSETAEHERLSHTL